MDLSIYLFIGLCYLNYLADLFIYLFIYLSIYLFTFNTVILWLVALKLLNSLEFPVIVLESDGKGDFS